MDSERSPGAAPAPQFEKSAGLDALLDLGSLRILLEKFAAATGFAVSLLSHPGRELLVSAGGRPVCADFHRACLASDLRCRESDQKLVAGLEAGRDWNLAQCASGLFHAAVPIRIRGRQVASLMIGQVLFEPPEVEQFRDQALCYGYDQEAYLRAIAEVPVVSEARLRRVVEFLREMAAVLGDQGAARLRAGEQEAELARLLAARRIAVERLERLGGLTEELLAGGTLVERMERIVEGVTRIFGAAAARIWLVRPGDRCASGCPHGTNGAAGPEAGPGPEAGRQPCARDRCLHLVASGGPAAPAERAADDGGEIHARVPWGCCTVGRIVAGEVGRDGCYAERIGGAGRDDAAAPSPLCGHEAPWAAAAGLTAFVGCPLHSRSGSAVGVLALYSRTEVTEEDRALLRSVAGTTAEVIVAARAEEQRGELERQMLHAQKLESLGVLAGGIAHDFNNILMAILGYADLTLMDLPAHSPVRDNLQAIVDAASRAAGLAKEMLAYSGRGRFMIEPIRISDFVAEMAQMLEVSVSKKVVLKYNFADNLPVFEGDATQIRQVIMNLITNASEAIGERSGVIALSTGAMNCDRAYLDTVDAVFRDALREPLAEGVYVYLEVADTGCGMDQETRQRLFDPFFTTKFAGRGLGMAAVQGIVRGHRGAIKVDSEVGRGTTFKVLFAASECGGEAGLAGAAGESEAEGGELKGKGTILIADDEESVCAVAKLMVERVGFRALTAADGYAAVELFRRHAAEIVCVVMDLTMPRLDGHQAFTEMRRIRPEVRVILSSGYNQDDATERFAGKGLAGFVQKPYEARTLLAEIGRVLAGDAVSEEGAV